MMTDTDMQLEEALEHLVHWPDQRKYASRIRELFKQKQEERDWYHRQRDEWIETVKHKDAVIGKLKARQPSQGAR